MRISCRHSIRTTTSIPTGSAQRSTTAPVFANSKGGELRRSNFYSEHWKKLRESAGLPNVRFHDLRHTVASVLGSRGVNSKVVQSVLGHSNHAITMDLYSHLMDGMQEKAADAMEEVFGGDRS
ncbi:MAG: tyrosine-type recombinase/integrase [Deltaproteobacteria bacterium]|nr:tyrosine-type recombinase/integrase [Deltaproteobacteria bacterium]MBW2698281.1 tyrosine-type recombinase/integrase [Deltaproteobacteria bacterium]